MMNLMMASFTHLVRLAKCFFDNDKTPSPAAIIVVSMQMLICLGVRRRLAESHFPMSPLRRPISSK